MLCKRLINTWVPLSFLLLVFISSSTQLAEGRPNPKSTTTTITTTTTTTTTTTASTASSKTAGSYVGGDEEDEKVMMRPQIGSRPPRCESRCSSCARCEAIQVPTNPQAHNGNSKSKNVSKIINADFYSRGDENTNYKPMSWKCKCGNFIFNP